MQRVQEQQRRIVVRWAASGIRIPQNRHFTTLRLLDSTVLGLGAHGTTIWHGAHFGRSATHSWSRVLKFSN